MIQTENNPETIFGHVLRVWANSCKFFQMKTMGIHTIWPRKDVQYIYPRKSSVCIRSFHRSSRNGENERPDDYLSILLVTERTISTDKTEVRGIVCWYRSTISNATNEVIQTRLVHYHLRKSWIDGREQRGFTNQWRWACMPCQLTHRREAVGCSVKNRYPS